MVRGHVQRLSQPCDRTPTARGAYAILARGVDPHDQDRRRRLPLRGPRRIVVRSRLGGRGVSIRSFAEDDAWMSRARRVDGRATSRADVLVGPGEDTVYPHYASRMKGAYLWDVDGHRYIDYMLGYGPVILGHADDRV